MTLELLVSNTALEQVDRICAWYDLRSSGMGTAFLKSLEADLTAIKKFPRGFTIIRGTLRQAPMTRFPHVIMFQVTGKRITILRVVHGRRDPKHRTG